MHPLMLLMIGLVAIPGLAIFMFAVSGKLGNLDKASQSALWLLLLLGAMGLLFGGMFGAVR